MSGIDLPQDPRVNSFPTGNEPLSSGEDLALSPAQIDLINYFADFAARFNLPRSAGQIYGLLFGQSRALPFEEIVSLLGISKGSASGSLKLLRQLKGVRVHHELGDRRTHYEAETSVRQLVRSFFEEAVRSHLLESEERLRKIADRLSSPGSVEDDSAPLLSRRLASLQSWHHKAQKLLPWIGRFTLDNRATAARKESPLSF